MNHKWNYQSRLMEVSNFLKRIFNISNLTIDKVVMAALTLALAVMGYGSRGSGTGCINRVEDRGSWRILAT